MQKMINRALLSVSDKTGLDILVDGLKPYGIEFISTGGTAAHLKNIGAAVTDVSAITQFPEMMDGRLKTLHPMVHGGLLGNRNNSEHVAAMKEHKINGIDLLVVNLYPFRETVKRGGNFDSCIENIDIGGPAMVRSAAKNHTDVVVIVDPADYTLLLDELKSHDGKTTLLFRQRLAAKAFAHTGAYDAAISQWFAGKMGDEFPQTLVLSAKRSTALRYGENPHQKAAFYVTGDEPNSVAEAKLVQGESLSYNNLADADAAFTMVADFDEPSCSIIKHANPCGFATADTLAHAYDKALAGDPVSAYGGIIAFNRKVDAETAQRLSKLFIEVVIAPDFESAAMDIFKAKKKLRILQTGGLPKQNRLLHNIKTIESGMLFQQRDAELVNKVDLKIVSKKQPTAQDIEELLFAFRVCKHVKSNAIVLTRERSTIGIGAGQTSRVDASNIASEKARIYLSENPSKAPVYLASDAFFPFADGVVLAAQAGVYAIIQPGGSIRDEEVIKAADDRGIIMVFTGKRHFLH